MQAELKMLNENDERDKGAYQGSSRPKNFKAYAPILTSLGAYNYDKVTSFAKLKISKAKI